MRPISCNQQIEDIERPCAQECHSVLLSFTGKKSLMGGKLGGESASLISAAFLSLLAVSWDL